MQILRWKSGNFERKKLCLKKEECSLCWLEAVGGVSYQAVTKEIFDICEQEGIVQPMNEPKKNMRVHFGHTDHVFNLLDNDMYIRLHDTDAEGDTGSQIFRAVNFGSDTSNFVFIGGGTGRSKCPYDVYITSDGVAQVTYQDESTETNSVSNIANYTSKKYISCEGMNEVFPDFYIEIEIVPGE